MTDARTAQSKAMFGKPLLVTGSRVESQQRILRNYAVDR